MTERAYIQDRKGVTARYVSREDFCRTFTEDLEGLYQLSLLLTRNSEKAERCFVGGFEDCVAGNSVFREWARSWAKRTIIQNAIRELKQRFSLAKLSASSAIFSDIDQPSNGLGDFEVDAVFRLEDFERFMFVVSALEHSEHDCAVLLECSVQKFGKLVAVLSSN